MANVKTKYKYIHFEKDPCKGGKDWFCFNNKGGFAMGVVEYYETWRQYVIEFYADCVFNAQCLNDISDFLTQLNKTLKVKPPCGKE